MQLLSMHVDTVRALQRLHIPFDDLTPDGLWGTPYHLIGVTGDQRDVLNAWGVVYDEVTPAVFQRSGFSAALGAGGGSGSNGNRNTSSLMSGRMDARPEPRLEYRPESRPETTAPPQSLATGSALSPQPPVVVAPPSAAPAQQPQQSQPQPTTPAPSTSSQQEQPQQPQQQPQQPPAAASTPAPAAAAAPTPAASGKGAKGATAAAAATPAPAVATAPAGDDQLRDGTRLRTSFRGRYREATVRGGKILLDGRPFDSLTQASSSISPDKNEWEFWEYFDDGAGKWRMLDREWQA